MDCKSLKKDLTYILKKFNGTLTIYGDNIEIDDSCNFVNKSPYMDVFESIVIFKKLKPTKEIIYNYKCGYNIDLKPLICAELGLQESDLISLMCGLEDYDCINNEYYDLGKYLKNKFSPIWSTYNKDKKVPIINGRTLTKWTISSKDNHKISVYEIECEILSKVDSPLWPNDNAYYAKIISPKFFHKKIERCINNKKIKTLEPDIIHSHAIYNSKWEAINKALSLLRNEAIQSRTIKFESIKGIYFNSNVFYILFYLLVFIVFSIELYLINCISVIRLRLVTKG